MLAADPAITKMSTWDATTWFAAATALIALGALVTAVFARSDSRRSSLAGADSAEAAKRAATAAERATAVQEREAAQRRADRYDASGPSSSRPATPWWEMT